MKKIILVITLTALLLFMSGCTLGPPVTDRKVIMTGKALSMQVVSSGDDVISIIHLDGNLTLYALRNSDGQYLGKDNFDNIYLYQLYATDKFYQGKQLYQIMEMSVYK